jgi:hypothetical protein
LIALWLLKTTLIYQVFHPSLAIDLWWKRKWRRRQLIDKSLVNITSWMSVRCYGSYKRSNIWLF